MNIFSSQVFSIVFMLCFAAFEVGAYLLFKFMNTLSSNVLSIVSMLHFTAFLMVAYLLFKSMNTVHSFLKCTLHRFHALLHDVCDSGLPTCSLNT